MNVAERTLWCFEIIIGVAVMILAIIYSIPIIFIRRFHLHNNILTLNVCIGTIISCVYWIFDFWALQLNTILISSKSLCAFLKVIQIVCAIQVPFSIVAVSVHRLCIVVYHTNHLFKTKQWVLICILVQWIFVILLSLLTLADIQSSCNEAYWVGVYRLLMCVIIPSVVCLVINVFIFVHVRSSSRRVQPQSPVVQNNTGSAQGQRLSRRDEHLLRHMIFIFCIFVGGWTPICLISVIFYGINLNLLIYLSFSILCELVLLCDIIDLFLYNHTLRNYLKTILLRCF